MLCGGGRVSIYLYTLPPPYIYTSLHCHHQNDSCIRWAAMRAISMFHCEDKVTRQCPQTTAVFEEKGEPKRNRAAALLLRLTARPNRLSLSLAFFVFVLFVCLLLHRIGFMLFIAKIRAEPWARTPETWASDFAWDYTACFYCPQVALSRLVTSSRSLGCCRSKT